MRRGRGAATPGVLGDADFALSTTAQVKAAVAAAAKAEPRQSGSKRFAFDQVSTREAAVAPILGIYLGFAVARLHERFPVLQVPYLLWGLMAIMLATLWGAVPAAGWKKAWTSQPQFKLVAVLGFLATITVPLGIWMSGSLDYLLNRFTIAAAVFVACLFLLRDRRALRRVIALYVAITTVVAATNLVGYFGGDLSLTMLSAEEQATYQETGVVNTERLRQTFGSLDPNDIAAVMATTLPLALWLSVGSFRRRMLWTPSALIMVVAVVPTASRGGLLGLAAAAIVLVLVGAKGGKRVFLVSTLAIGALAFMMLAGSQLDRMGEFGGTDYNFTSSEGRIAIWKRGIVWMIRRPWGYGLNNFPIYFGWMNGPDRAAHNSLIQYGVELGVLGLAAYLWICTTLVKSLLAIRRNALRAGAAGQEMLTLSGHVLAMLAACWTTGFFLSNAYYPMTYMAIGIGSAVVLGATGAAKPVAASPAPVPGVRRRRHLKAFEPV